MRLSEWLLRSVTGGVEGGAHLARQLVERVGYLPLVGAYRDNVGVPLIHAGRIADLPTARHALGEGSPLLELFAKAAANTE